MRGGGSSLVVLVGIGWLAALPVAAGEVQGTVDCADRCGDFVIYLEGGASHDGAGQVVELGQKNKTFIPHVLPLLKGSGLLEPVLFHRLKLQ